MTDATGTRPVLLRRSRLLVKTVDPLGNPSYQSYDSNFNLDSDDRCRRPILQLRLRRLRQPDEHHRPARQHQPVHLHGPFNDLTSLTDANGNVTHYAYDASGNLVSTTYADGTSRTAAYDPRATRSTTTNRRRRSHHLHVQRRRARSLEDLLRRDDEHLRLRRPRQPDRRRPTPPARRPYAYDCQ